MSYQELLNKLLKKEHSIITKLNLLYEINCRFDCCCDDELVNKFYYSYLYNENFTNVSDFVGAIHGWCAKNETDFDLIEHYDIMLKELKGDIR